MTDATSLATIMSIAAGSCAVIIAIVTLIGRIRSAERQDSDRETASATARASLFSEMVGLKTQVESLTRAEQAHTAAVMGRLDDINGRLIRVETTLVERDRVDHREH